MLRIGDGLIPNDAPQPQVVAAFGLSPRTVAHQVVDKVHFGSRQVLQAEGIDNQFHAAAIKLHIAIHAGFFELEPILESRTPATLDVDPKAQFRVFLCGDKRVQLADRAVGQLQSVVVGHFNSKDALASNDD